MAGNAKKTSAVMAGYSEKTASQTASRLEKNEDVMAFWERQGWPETPEQVKKAEADLQESVSKAGDKPDRMAAISPPEKDDPYYADPLKFMEFIMNDQSEDPKLRLDAAKALAGFVVQKPGEKGKKGEREEAAKKVASKFSGLRSVK